MHLVCPADEDMLITRHIGGQLLNDLAGAGLNGCNFTNTIVQVKINHHNRRQLLPNGIQRYCIAFDRGNGEGIVMEFNSRSVRKGILIAHISFRPAQELVAFASQIGGQVDHIAHARFACLVRCLIAIVIKGNGHLGGLGLPDSSQLCVTIQFNGITSSLHISTVVNLPTSELLLVIGSSKGAFGQGVGGTPCCFSCTLVRIIICN